MLIRKRMKSIEEALGTKSRMEEELLATSKWLYDMQEEVKQLSKALGHTEEDANNRIQLIKVSPAYVYAKLYNAGLVYHVTMTFSEHSMFNLDV